MDFISLFSGAGGLDLGLEWAGWCCRYASDIDLSAIETLQSNSQASHRDGFGRKMQAEVADVRDLRGKDILAKIGVRRGSIPLMAGGPPCQSWSSAGHQRGFDDPRGVLFRDFVRLADECGCRIILFENVRGLLTARGPDGEPGGALRVIREEMWARGYQSSLELLNAADFGVPQRRVRLYLVGYRGTPAPVFPEPTHAKVYEPEGLPGFGKKPWVPMRTVLLTPSQLKHKEIILPSAKMVSRLKGLGPGEGVKSVGKKETTRPGGHWGYMQGGFVADPDLPARTVTASSQQDWIRLGDGSYRRLCPRECALIQGFPRSWSFVGRVPSVYKQIGNAVAPVMGEVLGRVVTVMANHRDQTRVDFDPTVLPRHLEAHVRYTAREHERNGASRNAAPSRRRVSKRRGSP